MIFVNFIYSLFLPATIWLLYSAPDLKLAGNIAVFIVVVLHLYAVIWAGSIFRAVSGDEFTYGMLSRGINLCSFLTTFVAGLITFVVHDWSIQSVNTISPFAWGVIALGFLVTLGIPLLSTRYVRPLPKSSDRREFEDPSKG